MPTDETRRLVGTSTAPALPVGSREDCLFRDCLVVVTGWTDAPIPWPRGLPVGKKGHPSLVVTAELVRAVREESADAVRHWWGLSAGVVWRYRRAFGVTLTGNPRTAELRRASAELGAEIFAYEGLTDEQSDAKSERAREGGYAERMRAGYDAKRAWKAWELELLATMTDAEVAAKTGRSVNAVRLKRGRR